MQDPTGTDALFAPLQLPCGVTLRNRIAKSAMSDSLGDGTGHPTPEQIALYRRWAQGGVALSIIGEVQGRHDAPEKPGNLVLNDQSDLTRFEALAEAGQADGAQLWLQLGHAGALAFPPISRPKGPSALDLPGLTCAELTLDEIAALPEEFARTTRLARRAGFGGVQVHAAHGFLLSQFLSPLFNRRTDGYGGSPEARRRLLFEVIEAVTFEAGPGFAVGIKLNATDQLQGGLTRPEALDVVAALDATAVDLIDISGGTYFPGAPAASDGGGRGPYFTDFAALARGRTSKPLMVTGGFKTAEQAEAARAAGATDMIGLARALALLPDLPQRWQAGRDRAPAFPRFRDPPEGGVTAWYTMRLTALAEQGDGPDPNDLPEIIAAYEARDRARAETWRGHFGV